VTLAVLFALTIGVAMSQLMPAFASSPPSIGAELYEEVAGSTRAHIDASLNSGGDVEISWRGEYATSETLLNEGKGIVAASGHTEKANGEFALSQRVALGVQTASGVILQHLQPSTTYYARFHVENSAKETAERTFSFVTASVALPEIARSLRTLNGNSAFTGATTFRFETTGRNSAFAKAQIESNGAQAEYSFEYAPAEAGHAPVDGSAAWAPFSSGANGTVTVAEDYTETEAKLTGLAPETVYYARVKLHSALGAVVERKTISDEEGSTETFSAKPLILFSPAFIHNVTDNSAYLLIKGLGPSGSETQWWVESATSASGPWTRLTSVEGTVTQAEAEEDADAQGVEGPIVGLKPATTYYLRLSAKNAFGEKTSPAASFKTAGPPSASTQAVHAIHGEALHLLGTVNPGSALTSAQQRIAIEGSPGGGSFTLTLMGQTTAPIAFDASAQAVDEALATLSTISGNGVEVGGRDGGPYTLIFEGPTLKEREQPAIVADASSLTPSGTVAVSVLNKGGQGSDAHYHFEYTSQAEFEAHGFTGAADTSEVDLGSGDRPDYVGADLPPLTAGETYAFRIVATNTTQGNPVVDGEVQSLTVPPASESPSSTEVPGTCPNEALRTGASAALPDCRAYEQVTPAEKEGTQEIYNYGASINQEGTIVGEDGNHLEYGSAFVKYGDTPGSGQSPYFFSRGEAGWSVTAAAPQPEAGIDNYKPVLFHLDLTQVAFESLWQTGPTGESPDVEFRAGPPGGPYTTVASVTRKVAESGGWAAASEDFSKLVLQLDDPGLLGSSTHTKAGASDLYEYSAGHLRQVNVSGALGSTIGSCGATIAKGKEGVFRSSAAGVAGSRHSVSSDGSHVFFEAVPGSNCGESKHLYVRIDGGGEHAETVDVGAYRFVAANSTGSTVLLERTSGENPGLYLYKEGGVAPAFLPESGAVASLNELGSGRFAVSQDMSTIYFLDANLEVPDTSGFEDLYQYSIPSEKLSLVAHLRGAEVKSLSLESDNPLISSVSPDGRYVYFTAGGVRGLPGGSQVLQTPHAGQNGQSSQAYRYDRAQALVQCISCASPFDPEPHEDAVFAAEGGEGANYTAQGMPSSTTASANGDYVFFDTPAALLPADVDGEITPETAQGAHLGLNGSADFSVSSDVYEWRRDGVSGCAHAQGCLALITTGGGGVLNILIGSAEEGRDVFFATNEPLVPADNDTASDVYDARIDGGFPEPSRPVECEGDACAPPFAPPVDVTPASATFQGAGNIPATTAPPSVSNKPTQKPKAKKQPRCTAKAKHKCKKSKKHAKAKSNKRGKGGQVTRLTTTSRRAGR
jgi:hypothetical protein